MSKAWFKPADPFKVSLWNQPLDKNNLKHNTGCPLFRHINRYFWFTVHGCNLEKFLMELFLNLNKQNQTEEEDNNMLREVTNFVVATDLVWGIWLCTLWENKVLYSTFMVPQLVTVAVLTHCCRTFNRDPYFHRCGLNLYLQVDLENKGRFEVRCCAPPR